MNNPTTRPPQTPGTFEQRLLTALLEVHEEQRAAAPRAPVDRLPAPAARRRRRIVLVGLGAVGAASVATAAVAAGALLGGPELVADGSTSGFYLKLAGC